MHDLGIHTGSDLRRWSEVELAREFGKSGGWLYQVARGIDHRPVRVSRTRKSIGSERTFGDNLQHRDEMLSILSQLTQELLEQLEKKSLGAKTVTVKVRFGDFSTFTRAHTHNPGMLTQANALRALPFLLDRALALRNDMRFSGSPARAAHSSGAALRSGVRLLGVSFSSLKPQNETGPEQLEMQWPES